MSNSLGNTPQYSSFANSPPKSPQIPPDREDIDRLLLLLPTSPEEIINLKDIITHHGISSNQLKTLVSFVVKKESPLNLLYRQYIVKELLFPRHRIPRSVILTILGSLGSGKQHPDARVQISLVKWLWNTCFFVRNPEKTWDTLNGILFNLLNLSYLAPWLCQILVLTTKSSHIRPWRLSFLQSVASKRLDSSPFVWGLLKHYTSLVTWSSHFIKEIPSFSAAAVTKSVDSQWLAKWSAIMKESAMDFVFQASLSEFLASVYAAHSSLGARKRHREPIELSQTLGPPTNQVELKWSQINTASKLLKHFSYLQIPLQLHFVFETGSYFSLLALYLVSEAKNQDLSPFDEYLQLLVAEEQFSELKSVLKGCLVYYKITGDLHNTVVSLMKLHLPQQLLSTALDFFQFFTVPSGSQENFTDFTPLIWQSYKEKFRKTETIEYCIGFTNTITEWLTTCLDYIDNDEQIQYLFDIHCQFQSLLLDAFVKFNGDPLFTKLLLSSQEFLAISENFPVNNAFFQMVSPFWVHRALFSGNMALIDSICGYIMYLKNYPLHAIRDALREEDLEEEALYFDQCIKTRNYLVLDVCNLLWRNKGFTKNGTLGFELSQSLVDKLSFDAEFGSVICDNGAFAIDVKNIVQELREEADSVLLLAPVSKQFFENNGTDVMLSPYENYDDFRVIVLEKLSKVCGGVTELLFNSLKSVSKRRSLT